MDNLSLIFTGSILCATLIINLNISRKILIKKPILHWIVQGMIAVTAVSTATIGVRHTILKNQELNGYQYMTYQALLSEDIPTAKHILTEAKFDKTQELFLNVLASAVSDDYINVYFQMELSYIQYMFLYL